MARGDGICAAAPSVAIAPRSGYNNINPSGIDRRVILWYHATTVEYRN